MSKSSHASEKPFLTPYTVSVLRAVDVAGDRGWVTAGQTARFLVDDQASDQTWWVRSLSRGKVYGELIICDGKGLVASKEGTVRGKASTLYQLTDEGRKAMLFNLRRMMQQLQDTIKASEKQRRSSRLEIGL